MRMMPDESLGFCGLAFTRKEVFLRKNLIYSGVSQE